MVTDIAIELAMLFDIARGRERQSDPAPHLARLGLFAQTVLCFLLGGFAGVVVYKIIGGFLLLGTAVGLFEIALSGIVRVRRRKSAAASP